MKKGIVIFMLLAGCAFPHWLEKKVNAYIKKILDNYLREIKIERVEYIFPNKANLIGISYAKDGFSFKGNGILEVNISLFQNIEPVFYPKLTIDRPQFSLSKDFFKKKGEIPIPNIEVLVENGNGEIRDVGALNNVSGYIREGRFKFSGLILGAKAHISGKQASWTAYIENSKLSLFPFFPKIKKGGLADIILKKEKELEVLVKIKNGIINIKKGKKIKKIKGSILFKEKKSKGRLTFLYEDVPFIIKFNEKLSFYNIMGEASYKKIHFPFSIAGKWRDNVFSITKGEIKNIKVSGLIGENISLSLFFDKGDNILSLINPALSRIILNGSSTIRGSFDKPSLTGSFTLTKDNNVLQVSIFGDNNNLSFKTGTISLSGIDIASSLIGTISLKPFSISSNFINPILFDNGKIEGGGEISFFRDKRRLFIKKDKDIKFRYADIIKGIPLDCYGRIALEKGMIKAIIEYGKIGDIPINNGLANIKLKEKIIIEDFKLLIDGVTSIYAEGEITKDNIDIPIIITQIKTGHIYKNLALQVDFKGKVSGNIKKPTICGELYSPEPKLMSNIIMIDDSLILKGGRVYNTNFEFSLFIPTGSISGFAEFKDEEFLKLSSLLFPISPIAGKANGGAICSGSINNPEIIGSLTLSNPSLFRMIQGDDMNLSFKLRNKSFSSLGTITSNGGSVSFMTHINPQGEIETNGNISNFRLADIPIIGSLSFKGLYRDETIEGTLSLKNIWALGYMIPDIVEKITYKEGNIRFSGIISGFIEDKEASLLVSLKDFNIGPSKITGTITACGEIENPEINGEIEIIGSNFTFPIFLEPFSEIRCKIKIDEGIIKILSFKGNTKKTKITLSQIKENLFEVKTEGEPIKIDIPGLIKAEADCELIVEHLKRGFKTKGRIVISNARFTYPPIKTKGISFLEEFIYGPKIEAGYNVWFYNEFCEAEIENGGFLRLKNIDGMIKAEGSCRSKRGRISYLGNNFTIYDANFEFRDGIPYLTGYAEARINKISLTISHSGMLSLPLRLNLFSKTHPEKTQDELTRLLEEKKERPAGFIASIVGERIVEQVSRSVRHWTMLNLEVTTGFPEAIFSGTQTYFRRSLVGTEVKIGRYLTKRFYLIYECLIEGYEEERYKYRQKIGFEHDLGRKAYLRYLYTPKGEKREKEHEISIKKSISF